ncbi:MAG: hypothetical protein QXJ68_00600 [Methanocellales archaeon]
MVEKSTAQDIIEIRYKMLLAIAVLIVGLLVVSTVLWFIFKKL